jgi:iron uptake system EfeUOB component EfeO/EfeM
MRLVAALACAAALLGAAGCGGDGEAGSDPGPLPLSAEPTDSGTIPHARPADFKAPIAAYKRDVSRQLAAMSVSVGQLQSAVAAGDLEGARQAWLDADGRYESIGAAYGAFGDFDGAINRLWDGLPGRTNDPDFTGLHRIELALWGRDSTGDAGPYVSRLASDVERLHTKVPQMDIDPLDYALRCHEVLEDTLNLQLSGRASPWSGAALVALRSNIDGTEFVLGTLRPLVARRNPQILATIDTALARLRGAVRQLQEPGGALPRWGSLPQRERERVFGLTAAATERLAYVPEIADPRPPRPAQRVFGTDATTTSGETTTREGSG